MVRRWFEEVWNQGRVQTVDELYAEAGVSFGLALAGTALEGRAALKAVQDVYRRAFPDLRFTVDDVVEEGDRCAVRFRARGTNTGTFFGMAATGKSVVVDGQCILRFHGGQMVETWNQFDLFGLLRQLGAVALP